MKIDIFQSCLERQTNVKFGYSREDFIVYQNYLTVLKLQSLYVLRRYVIYLIITLKFIANTISNSSCWNLLPTQCPFKKVSNAAVQILPLGTWFLDNICQDHNTDSTVKPANKSPRKKTDFLFKTIHQKHFMILHIIFCQIKHPGFWLFICRNSVNT